MHVWKHHTSPSCSHLTFSEPSLLPNWILVFLTCWSFWSLGLHSFRQFSKPFHLSSLTGHLNSSYRTTLGFTLSLSYTPLLGIRNITRGTAPPSLMSHNPPLLFRYLKKVVLTTTWRWREFCRKNCQGNKNVH